MVRRIKDELIDTLDFRKKLEIAISDMQYNIASVLSESETESKQKKSGETRPGFFSYLLRYPMQKIERPNSKFEIPI